MESGKMGAFCRRCDDRFEAAATIHAEMAAGKDTDMGELGFLQHDVDSVTTEKQDL